MKREQASVSNAFRSFVLGIWTKLNRKKIEIELPFNQRHKN